MTQCSLVPVNPAIVGISHSEEIILPNDASVCVTASPHPFSVEYVTKYYVAGTTLGQIVCDLQPIEILRKRAHIFIGEHYIPQALWDKVRPKPNTHVTIRMVPAGGGGGGGKSPMRVLMTVALIAAAYFAPMVAAQMGVNINAAIIGSGQFALTVGKVISGAVMLIGGMLMNAIAPVPKPKMRELTQREGRDSPTLFIEGTRNELRPYQPVARILGRHRYVPPYAARPFTETVGDTQYMRGIFCWGYGPIKLESEKISETVLSAFAEVETEFRRGYQPSQMVAKGNWDASSGSFPASPVFGDTWTVSVAGTVDSVAYAVDETITFNGLYSGTLATAWDKDQGKPLKLYPSDVYENSFQITLTQANSWQMRTSQLNADEISIDVSFPQGLTRFSSDGGTKGEYSVTFEVESSPTGAGTWTSRGSVTVTARQTNTVRRGVRWTTESRGQYDVRIRRTTADSDDSAILDETVWTALRTFTNEDPVSMEGVALTAMRIKATDQLHGVVDEYNGIITSILKDWDTGTSTWKHQPTSNPASHMREVYMGAANARPLAESRVHLESLQEFHVWCTSKGYEFNMIRDFVSSVNETLTDIAAAGRGSKILIDGKWGVVYDQPQTVPVQHFTPRNSWGFKGRRTFPKLPHAFRIPFPNREHNWESDERIVYHPSYNESTATLFEQIEFPGITDKDHIWKLGQFHWAQILNRLDEYEVFTDFEYIIARRGSLVSLAHDVISTGLSWGRIKSLVLNEPGEVIQIVLDEEVSMELGVSYGVAIRTANDANLTRGIVTVAGNTKTLSLSSSISAAQAPIVGDLVTFGLLGLETLQVLVKSIEPSSDLVAKITCVDYAAGVYTADSGTIPTFTTTISQAAGVGYPAVVGIDSDEDVLVLLPGGGWLPQIQVTLGFTGRALGTVVGIECRYRPQGSQGPWQYVTGDTNITQVLLTDVITGTMYEFQLRYLLADDGFGSWGPLLTHTVVGANSIPADITTVLQDTTIATWIYTPPRDFKGYKVRYLLGTAINWADGIDVGGLILVTNFDLTLLPAGPVVLMVKAIDLADNESVNPGYLLLNQGDPAISNVVTTFDLDATGYPGIITNGTVVGSELRATDAGELYLPEASGLYLPTGSDLYLPVQYLEMVYNTIIQLPAGDLPCNVVFVPTVQGTWDITYRWGHDQLYLPVGGDLYLPVGGDLYLPYFWHSDPIPWIGSAYADGDHESIQFYVTTYAGTVQGKITNADVILDADDESEIIQDVMVPSAGMRLTLTKSYRSIKRVGYTFQTYPGYTAERIEVEDKNPTLGPRVQPYHSQSNPTEAFADFYIQGVKL